jgi:hypothetical protein
MQQRPGLAFGRVEQPGGMDGRTNEFVAASLLELLFSIILTKKRAAVHSSALQNISIYFR